MRYKECKRESAWERERECLREREREGRCRECEGRVCERERGGDIERVRGERERGDIESVRGECERE